MQEIKNLITENTAENYVGCWYDGVGGRYIGEHVQTLAQINGWKGDPLSADDEFYHEAFDEAELFLNELIPDGYYFGPQPDSGGDWGFYRQDDIEQNGLFEDAVYQYQNNL